MVDRGGGGVKKPFYFNPNIILLVAGVGGARACSTHPQTVTALAPDMS